MLLYVLAAIAALYAVLHWYTWRITSKIWNKNTGQTVPHISFFALLGKLLFAKKHPADLLYDLYKQYGAVMHNFLGIISLVTINDPKMAYKMLLNTKKYEKQQVIKSDFMEQFIGSNVVLVNGEPWRRYRKLMDPAFIHIERFVDVMREKSDICVNHLAAKPSIAIAEEMTKLTLDILGKAVFGYDFDYVRKEQSTTIDSYKLLITESTRFVRIMFPLYNKLPLDSNRKLSKAIDEMNTLIYRLIDESKQKAEKGTLLDVMIEKVEGEQALTNKELRDNLMVLFVAGHESTSTTLSWILYLLAKHPAEQERLIEEIATKCSSDELTFEQIQSLDRLTCVIKETLRLYPPAFSVMRTANEDDTVGDWFIPQNTTVSIGIFNIHRNEELWPNPLQFIPDRFLDKNIPAYAWMPFSVGPRNCLGMTFSLLEQKIFLIQLFKSYRVKLVNPNYQAHIKYGSIMSPDDGCLLQFEKL